MNIKKISVAVLMLSLAGAALAEAPYPDETKFVSTKTRAEVIAELQQARANGELVVGDEYPGPAIIDDVAKSTKTRAQVIEELKQARARGELPIDDDYAVTAMMATPSTKTRAEVIQELKEYRAAHAGQTTFLR